MSRIGTRSRPEMTQGTVFYFKMSDKTYCNCPRRHATIRSFHSYSPNEFTLGTESSSQPPAVDEELLEACRNGQTGTAKMLIANKPNVQAKTDVDIAALHFTVTFAEEHKINNAGVDRFLKAASKALSKDLEYYFIFMVPKTPRKGKDMIGNDKAQAYVTSEGGKLKTHPKAEIAQLLFPFPIQHLDVYPESKRGKRERILAQKRENCRQA
eukprot:jgi/Bigna1/87685/estExt_fgenesh1_pg.C_230048